MIKKPENLQSEVVLQQPARVRDRKKEKRKQTATVEIPLDLRAGMSASS